MIKIIIFHNYYYYIILYTSRVVVAPSHIQHVASFTPCSRDQLEIIINLFM